MYLLYSLLVIILSYFGDRRRGGNAFTRLLPCLCFILFVGLRKYTVGVDSENYQMLFYQIPLQNYIWIEVAFDKLIRILYDLGFDYNSLYLSSIVLTAIPIYLFLEKQDHYTIPAVYIYIMSLLMVCNGIRQCIAVGIFLYASIFIIQRRIIPYILCIGIAYLFHHSALILFPLYFIANRTLSNVVYVLVYVLSFAFCFMNLDAVILSVVSKLGVVGLTYAESFEYFSSKDMSVFGLLYTSAINVSTFYLMLKARTFKTDPVISNFTYIYIVLKNLSFQMTLISRVMMYFDWYAYFIYPIVAYKLCKNRQEKFLIILLFFILYGIIFIKNIMNPIMKMSPYLFYFQ